MIFHRYLFLLYGLYLHSTNCWWEFFLSKLLAWISSIIHIPNPCSSIKLPFQPLHCTIFNTSSIAKEKKIDKIINMFADVEFIVQENYVSSNFGNYFYKILLFNDIFHLLLYVILIKWLHVFVSNDNTTYLNMSIIYGRKFIWFISFFIKALVEKKCCS